MNDTDLHERFAAAVAMPGVDRIDLDAVLRCGRRRHRVRVAATVGSVVGVLALVGALGLGLFPRGAQDHVDPAYPTDSVSPAPSTPQLVTSVDPLLGTWAVADDTSPVPSTGRPPARTVTFNLVDGRSVWGVPGSCGGGTGEFTISTSGAFEARQTGPLTFQFCPYDQLMTALLTATSATLSGDADSLTLLSDRGSRLVALQRSAAPAPEPTTTPATAPAGTDDVLEVTCSAEGIAVSGDTVAAQRAGVVLRVSSTLPKGAYLAYHATSSPFGGTSGGDTLPATLTTWTRQFPPGPLTLSCYMPADDSARGPAATVTVVDPGGFWWPGELSEYGCHYSGLADFAAGHEGEGRTRNEAAAQVLRSFDRAATGTYVSSEHVPIGYAGAPDQYWIGSVDGIPYLLIKTWPTDTGYQARPDELC